MSASSRFCVLLGLGPMLGEESDTALRDIVWFGNYKFVYFPVVIFPVPFDSTCLDIVLAGSPKSFYSSITVGEGADKIFRFVWYASRTSVVYADDGRIRVPSCEESSGWFRHGTLEGEDGGKWAELGLFVPPSVVWFCFSLGDGVSAMPSCNVAGIFFPLVRIISVRSVI